MKTVTLGGLRAVQLHGREDAALVETLVEEGLVVIKALFVNGDPGLTAASHYRPTAFLVECAGGPLPGGNALDWNWAEARDIPTELPVVLAGGLTPDNIQYAIAAGRPDAVDVSSGVEVSPGRKDARKVQAFCRAVASCDPKDGKTVFG